MPILNGLDATKKIREIETAKSDGGHIPIVALTANAMKGDEQRCLNAGMDGYLIKPVHRHQLINTVKQWVDQAGSKQENASDAPAAPPSVSLPQPDHEVAVMDVTIAVDEFGDADTVIMVADQLIDNVAGQLQMIRQAIADEDRECIRKESHSIKGGAAPLKPRLYPTRLHTWRKSAPTQTQ